MISLCARSEAFPTYRNSDPNLREILQRLQSAAGRKIAERRCPTRSTSRPTVRRSAYLVIRVSADGYGRESYAADFQPRGRHPEEARAMKLWKAVYRRTPDGWH